jgi:diguanylate cyclase (GGDEF)-like protein
VKSGQRDVVVSRLTVSIGVAVHPHDGHNLDQLLRAADAAMYDAKHAGRNRTALARTTNNHAPVRKP